MGGRWKSCAAETETHRGSACSLGQGKGQQFRCLPSVWAAKEDCFLGCSLSFGKWELSSSEQQAVFMHVLHVF